MAGETGSGKTTQLPKICLELGRGVRGLIGHTQPRRLAARTVADRIAEELGTELGGVVGYKVRFTDQVGDGTLVKLMTDGILLAELQHDRMLRQYDTLIIDEAHERSLNIDFILGYLRQLLPRRPDLKVIITSATIDPERFARHFARRRRRRRAGAGVEVSGPDLPGRGPLPAAGRVRRRRGGRRRGDRPRPDPGDRRRGRGAGRRGAGRHPGLPQRRAGDPGHRRRAGQARPEPARCGTPRSCRCTPGSPPPSSTGSSSRTRGRRVVLATNVAETSLTVPGIKYVVDPGTARISRYSHRLKVQRLPIEPISQASANQRKGRCGRTSDGICIRLYDEQDFLARPEFTDPEILRTNLASVILQMTAIGLGDIAAFPFIDPPDRRNIADGINLLHELGALEPTGTAPHRLTPLGRRLAQLPVDPRLARMVLEGERNGCADEVVVIAAALSIQDPRERPADRQAQADQAHARFTDKESDFVDLLNLWRYLQEQQRDAVVQRVPPDVQGRVPQLPAGPRVAGHLQPAAAGAADDLRRGHRRGRHAGGGGRGQRTDRHEAGGAAAPGVDRRGAGGAPREVDTERIHQSLLAGLLSATSGSGTPRRTSTSAPGAPVRPLPRVGAVQEAAALGDGRRAGRDLPALGPGRRPDRAGVGRGTRPAPGQAQLQRAALGEEAGRGDGVREGDPVRHPAGHRPQGQLRSDRPGAEPGAVHPARAGGGRLADPPPVLRTTTGSCSTRSRSWRTGPGAATSWSTTRPCSPSTTRGSRPRWSPAGTSTPGGRRAGRQQPDLLTFDRETAGQRRAGQASTRPTTPTSGTPTGWRCR